MRQRRGDPGSASRPAVRHHRPAIGAGRPGGRLGAGVAAPWPMPVAAVAAAAGCPPPRAEPLGAGAPDLRQALRAIDQHIDDYITRARLDKAA